MTVSSETARWARTVLPPVGFQVEVEGVEELEGLPERDVDVVLVELGSLGREARAVCGRLRAALEPRSIPLLALVPPEWLAEVDPLWGVDDLLLYPGSPLELVARLRFVRHRKGLVSPANGLVIEELVMDFDRYAVSLRGEPLYLTYKEYELLRYLASNPDRVFSREALLSQVWGYDYFGGTRTVDVHVRRLRQKLGPRYASLIQTVRQVGYKFSRELG